MFRVFSITGLLAFCLAVSSNAEPRRGQDFTYPGSQPKGETYAMPAGGISAPKPVSVHAGKQLSTESSRPTAPVCWAGAELPLPRALIRRYAQAVAKSSNRFLGASQVVGNVLAYAASHGQADEVTEGLLEAFDEIGDQDQLLPLMAETVSFSTNSLLKLKVKTKLTAVAGILDPKADRMELLKALQNGVQAFDPKTGKKIAKKVSWAENFIDRADNIRNAYLGYADEPEALAVEGALIGLKTLQKSNPKLFNQADRLRLAAMRVPSAAHLLRTTFSNATPAEYDQAMRAFLGDAKDAAWDYARLGATRALSKHLKPEFVNALETSFIHAFDAAKKKEPLSFDFNEVAFIESLAENNKQVATAKRFANQSYAALKAAEKIDRAELRKLLIEKLGPPALKLLVDIGGIFDPTPLCDVASCLMDIHEGKYVSASLSLLSMLPYLGDSVAKPLKISKAIKPLLKLAHEAQKMIARLNRIKNQAQTAARIAGIPFDMGKQLLAGEPILGDDLLAKVISIGMDRRNFARAGSELWQTMKNTSVAKDTPILDLADSIFETEALVRDAVGCKESRLTKKLRQVRQAFDEPIPDMIDKKIHRYLGPESPMRMFPPARVGLPIARGQAPETETDTLVAAAAKRFKLDAAGMTRLEQLVSEVSNPTPEHVIALAFQAKFPEE